MPSMPAVEQPVVGGIDTHKELHMAAVVALDGRLLATEAFSTTRAGYRALIRWLRGHGQVLRVGVEQTGSYGAGVVRQLALAGIPVLEVTTPDRAERRSHGKDDTLDAVHAARAAVSGKRAQVAKDRGGQVEALRVLRTTRKSAVRARRTALQLLRSVIIAAPDEVRDPVRSLTRMQLVRTCASWRPDRVAADDPAVAARVALRSLCRRYLELTDEIADLDELIEPLVRSLAPRLVEALGVGIEVAGQLLVTAGDNPDRLRSEAGFAKLCGAAPLPASTRLTQRHRLNRGGGRQANSALHMTAVCRLRSCPRTRAYTQRRLAEGLSKRETIRCIKRYLARELYHLLISDHAAGQRSSG